MDEESAINLSLKIPFSSEETAALVQEVLNVDKELKSSGITRTILLNKENLEMLNISWLQPQETQSFSEYYV